MSHGPKIRTKKIGRWIALVVGCLLVASLFVGKAGVGRIYRSFVDVKKKERALAGQRAELDSLAAQNARLKSDTAYMEKIAREKLGMARKDEKVYKFIGESK
jgi:cell division protein FtsB